VGLSVDVFLIWASWTIILLWSQIGFLFFCLTSIKKCSSNIYGL